MLDRSYLVILLSLIASISFANEANWNCQQDKKTKEWVCVGLSNTADKPSKIAAQQSRAVSTKQDKADKSLDKAATGSFVSGVERSAAVGTANKNQLLQEAKPRQVEKTPVAEVSEKPIAPTPTLGSQPNSAKPVPSPVSAEAPIKQLPATQKPMLVTNKISKSSTKNEVKQSGWDCDTKGADGNWNCNLVGSDPKGEARVVENERQNSSLFDPTFNDKEEQVFITLRDRLKNNPWANCTMQLGTQTYAITNKKQREQSDLDVDSNYSEIYDNEIGHYQGNVDIKRADQRASANSANYDSVSETLDLHGNVYYSEDELSLATDTATLKLASDEAKLRDTLFISPTTPIRGRANAIYRDSKTLSRYKGVAYTSCEPGNQDVILHASDLKMNKKTGDGSAKNAWLEFKGVPVFYSPYLSFPIDDRRKTGLLSPVPGYTNKGGFSISMPFYWNIAPNYDATLRPRYFANRGVLLAGDFRYLTEMSKGEVSAEYMPSDSLYNPKDPLSHKTRYFASIKNHAQFTPHISSNVDLNYVSDKKYFSEIGNALSFPNVSHVRSYADVAYADQGVSLVGRVESFETIDPSFTGRTRPYRRLPQINLNLNHTFASLPANTGLDSEYVYFQHDDPSLPDGYRFNVKPYVSFPLKTDSAFVTPKFSLQYSQYLLNNQKSGVSNSISRVVPIASIDSGLFLEKNINIFGNSLLHTLEPRLFYLYIPEVNQNDIPIFDTSLYDFQYDSLFRENRFSGSDRVQDANQITAALTSRFIDSKTGLERLKLSVGDIINFRNREVTAPSVQIGFDFLESPIQKSTFSPLVAELSSQLNKHVAIDAGLQWDPHTNDIVRGKAGLHFVNNPGELFNIGYTYRKNTLIKDSIESALADNSPDNAAIRANLNAYKNNDALYQSILRSGDIIQSDVSLRWPIYDNWYGIARWQYSLLYNRTQEGFIGFEKETCCWRFSVIGRHYVNNVAVSSKQPGTATGVSQEGIFFQIDFKGLSGIGNADMGSFLKRSIFGYGN